MSGLCHFSSWGGYQTQSYSGIGDFNAYTSDCLDACLLEKENAGGGVGASLPTLSVGWLTVPGALCVSRGSGIDVPTQGSRNASEFLPLPPFPVQPPKPSKPFHLLRLVLALEGVPRSEYINFLLGRPEAEECHASQ